jgi:hypothetical protein
MAMRYLLYIPALRSFLACTGLLMLVPRWGWNILRYAIRW